MLHPPKRLSLVAQVAASLREHLASSAPGESLPSERSLCAELGVSRMTLRAGLARIANEGLIQGGQGRRHRILEPKHSRHSTKTSAVVILSPVPFHALDPRVLFWVHELRQSLAKENYRLDFQHQRNCYLNSPASALRELTGRMRASVWLLYLSTRAMQEWFLKQKLPAIITGSRHQHVLLPSVDVNYRAACRHAVGRFISGGHKCLVLLNPRSAAGGDLESETAFREAGSRVETIVAHHDGTVKNIRQKLDQLLARPTPPTAFLISRPAHALTALGHLVQRGIDFPRHAALIARDHDSFLEHTVPSIARYHADPALFARKLSRVVLEMASGGDARPRDCRFIPRLIPGATLL